MSADIHCGDLCAVVKPIPAAYKPPGWPGVWLPFEMHEFLGAIVRVTHFDGHVWWFEEPAVRQVVRTLNHGGIRFYISDHWTLRNLIPLALKPLRDQPGDDESLDWCAPPIVAQPLTLREKLFGK